MSGIGTVVSGVLSYESTPLWKIFVDFWSYLFNLKEINEFKALGERELSQISRMAYDQFIQSVMKIITKLTAFQGSDLICFDNLVQFSTQILNNVHNEWFLSWVYTFGKQMIVYSGQFPKVSGFYRLLTSLMKTCEKHLYFVNLDETFLVSSEKNNHPISNEQLNEMQLDKVKIEDGSIDDNDNKNNPQKLPSNSSSSSHDPIIVSSSNLREKELAFVLFSKFIKEVLHLIKQYKDDLLVSCLEFLLVIPRKFIELPAMLPALELALTLGTR